MSRWMLRFAMPLVVVAAALAWLAVGELADAESDRAGIPARTLMLAEATASLARQLQATVDDVAIGANSAAEAAGHTETIAVNVRTILAALSDVDGAEGVMADLANAEASLLEAQGGLQETADALAAAQPGLAALVESLDALVLDLRSDAEVDGSNGHNALARAAIVAAAVAILLALAAVDLRAGQP